MLKWNDNLAMGIELIDNQHKAIIVKANEIFQMDEKTDKKDLKEIINYLMSYTNSHFLEEESLMIETDYDKFIEHRQQHNLFVERVYKIYLRINNDEIDRILFDDLKEIMADWLGEHLSNDDRDFAEYLNRKRKYI